MGRHEPLTLSLDDMLDIGFADDLLSHFDLKRDSLHSPPNASLPNDMDHKHLLIANKWPHSTNSNDINQLSPSILPPVSQHQGNNDGQDSAPKVSQDSAISPAATNVASIPNFILSPEENPSMILDTTLPASLTSLELPRGYSDNNHHHYQRQHGTSLHSTNKVKSKSTTASLPGTIADRANRRRQGSHNLLRRSSTYLRQKFFAGGADATEFPPPPPLPTLDPISVANTHIPNDSLTYGLETTVASNYISNDNSILGNNNNNNNNNNNIRTKTTSSLSPPPTPPSSCTPIIPLSTPLPPSSTNPGNMATPTPTITTTTSTTTTPTSTTTMMTTPVISPSQYPPKPLHYCPVDPPNDRHRTSFPIFSSWRKKSLKDPRRQSEPTIPSQHIKTRRSFFFR